MDEFLQYARTSPQFYFSRSEDLLAGYKATVERIEPLVPRVIGHVPPGGVMVERFDSDGVAAMWRKGRSGHLSASVMVAVNDPQIHPKFEMIALMLHEGTPGHDLQHAVEDEVNEGKKDLYSRFLNSAGQNPAYGEGWGLYAEGLGREMGLYREPMDEFGELRLELARAVRVVIDSGIHAQGWTAERAKEYYLKQTGKPEKEVDSEVRRTLYPGGQLAYKVGQNRIQMMREETARALGDEFDLRRFHDAILRWGPLPLDILRGKMAECLGTAECAAGLKGTKAR